MKFFADLGSCYRPISEPPSRDREEGIEAIHVAPPTTSIPRHAKRVKRFGGGGASASSSTAQHWRPDLQAIREDSVVDNSDGNTNKNCERRAHSHRETKSKDRYPSNPRRVSYYYCSRNNSAPMIIPAFSPTPFMF